MLAQYLARKSRLGKTTLGQPVRRRMPAAPTRAQRGGERGRVSVRLAYSMSPNPASIWIWGTRVYALLCVAVFIAVWAFHAAYPQYQSIPWWIFIFVPFPMWGIEILPVIFVIDLVLAVKGVYRRRTFVVQAIILVIAFCFACKACDKAHRRHRNLGLRSGERVEPSRLASLDGKAGDPFVEFVVGSRSFGPTGYSRPARTTCAQARHDLFADRERRGGARARRVQDVHGVGLLDEVEILHQFALRGDGLGAYAGAARIEIRCVDLRDQALQRLGEQALAERAFDFLPTHACVTRQKVPQARIGNSVEQIARIDIRLAVTFAREGEHSVRTCFNAAVNQTGEVHAEEGELRIGHGVDQVAHERLAVRLDLVILAAEWSDADFAAQTGQFADMIAMKAGAVDKELGFEVSRFGFGAPAAVGLSQRTYFGVGCDAALDAFHQGFADFLVIDNPFLRNA